MKRVGLCKNCRYWDAPEIEGNYGRCHRYAPRPGIEGNNVNAYVLSSENVMVVELRQA